MAGVLRPGGDGVVGVHPHRPDTLEMVEQPRRPPIIARNAVPAEAVAWHLERFTRGETLRPVLPSLLSTLSPQPIEQSYLLRQRVSHAAPDAWVKADVGPARNAIPETPTATRQQLLVAARHAEPGAATIANPRHHGPI